MIIGGPALTKYNDRSLKDLTTTPASAGGDTGAVVHIKTITASADATISFVNGASSVVLDDTYPVYKFEFINMHPATDNVTFQVNFRDGDTAYDATKTTTFFRAYHGEGGEGGVLQYQDSDLAQGTGFQMITTEIQLDNDGCSAGFMHLFNPSSTTFVKHFIAVTNDYQNEDRDYSNYSAGYGNTTSAVNAIQFKMNAGNIDAGDICLYGIA